MSNASDLCPNSNPNSFSHFCNCLWSKWNSLYLSNGYIDYSLRSRWMFLSGINTNYLNGRESNNL